MKTRNFMIALVICSIVFLSGCVSEAPGEAKIKEDIYSADGYMTTNAIIKTVGIEKRQTNKQEKSDTAYCKVVSQTESLKYTSFYKLNYTYYDKGGWILDSLETQKPEQWKIDPLKGVNIEIIKESFIGKNISVRYGDTTLDWVLTPEEITGIDISNQTTDLKAKTDKIEAIVYLDTGLVSSKGTLKLEYSFSDGKWSLSKFTGVQDFVLSYDVGKAPAFDEQVVASAIVNTPNEYGIKADEISDLTIKETEINGKGEIYIVNSNFIITKNIATMNIDAATKFIYSGHNWAPEETEYGTIRIISYNLIGKWEGYYDYEQQSGVKFGFEIKKMNSDGSCDITVDYAHYNSFGDDIQLSIDTFGQFYPEIMELHTGEFENDTYNFVSWDVNGAFSLKDGSFHGRITCTGDPSDPVTAFKVTPFPTQPEDESIGINVQIHIMAKGETINSIARKYYGSSDYAEKLCKYNGFTNPNLVQIGQKIMIPPKDELK